MSAYDLHHGFLPKTAVNEANIVFLDSGGYEILPPAEMLEPAYEVGPPRRWTEEDHLSLITGLKVDVDLIATTPDLYASVSEQLSRAARFRKEFPHFGTSLLLKPREPGRPLDIDEILDVIANLPQLDVLGFVDKDLGMTPLARCRALVQIRRRLVEHGFETPIHIYGCLDPPSVLAAHACGADIFDGLSWLRFAWREGTLEYHATSALRRGLIDTSDAALAYEHHVRNLSELSRLQDLIARGQAASHPDFQEYMPVLEKLLESAYEVV